jgi:hypothetical protein
VLGDQLLGLFAEEGVVTGEGPLLAVEVAVAETLDHATADAEG